MRFGSSSRNVSLVLGTLAIFLAMSVPLGAQETLGAITGTVKDTSGGVVADASVRARNTGTNQEITQHTDSNGFYSAQNLPIGDYEVTFSKEGFKTETHTQVYVSGNRTVTVDGTLQIGAVNVTVEVSATPLMNQVDTTNGYVVDQ